MTARIIDGKAMAAAVESEVKAEVAALGFGPKLAVVLVGEDAPSKVYVGNKEKACERAGIVSEKHVLPETTTEKELIALVQRLNKDDSVHGILVQLPLPKHISEPAVIAAVEPAKDVDGFHPVNIGNLFSGNERIRSCTPLGIITMLERSGIEIAGKHAVVVGRSNIVGKPVAAMLLNRNATVTVCHSKTRDLAGHTRAADILVVAVGQPGLIKREMVREGAVVIDVGINKVAGKTRGDVDPAVAEVASALSPVPGGVGPMTVAMLLKNVVALAKMKR